MRTLTKLVGALVLTATLGCSGSGSEAPLTAAECGELVDHFSEVLAQGLPRTDLAEWNADHAAERDAEIAECVAEQNWDRAGFECAMKATSQSGFQRCIRMH